MIRATAFRASLSIDEERLEIWTASGWIVPADEAGEPAFSETDAARGRLIASLQDEMGVNDAGVDVILSLLDQIHGLRGSLREVLEGLQQQPEEVRRHILLGRRGR